MVHVTSTEERVATLLRDYSTSESWVNRQLGAQLAAQGKHERYIPTLFLLTEDSNEWVRFHALCALQHLQPDRSLFTSALTKLERDPFFRIRSKAKEILQEMAQERVEEGPSH